MAHDVFISYAVKDKPIADAVCGILEGNRIRCWIAPRDLLPGVPYGKAIIDAINEARAMVIVFSASANSSPHVAREAERAVNKGIPILPFRVEAVLPCDSMEYILAGLHWLDALTPPMEDHIHRLAETVNLLLSAGLKGPGETKQGPSSSVLSSPEERFSRRGIEAPRLDIIDPSTGMEFVLVAGGEFEMGDCFGDGEPNEKPAHKVVVSDFHMGKYPVTQRQWELVMGSNPSKYREGPDHPVENVSWLDTVEFFKVINEKMGERYRLPTEAEWEYAARSRGKKEKWAGISSEMASADYAWVYVRGDFKSRAVGLKKPNGLGLHDMSGNVWEWCSDWYGEEYYANSPTENPMGPEFGTHRVYRGGSRLNSINEARTTYRGNGSPFGRSSNLGFRMVKTTS